jgi:hypothetical protein
MHSPSRSELCRKREARTMVRRFGPWLTHQLNVAMSIRLGIRMTDEQTQRIHDNMQEMIEDIFTDYGMRRHQDIRSAIDRRRSECRCRANRSPRPG